MVIKNKLVWDLITSIWCWWSNFRFRKTNRFSKEILDIDKVTNYKEIRSLICKFYNSFIWTADDITQLGDAITPPPQNYEIYLKEPLKDDCDGFHSLVYHCLYNSGIECYLMTANPAKIGDGHCILIFKLNDMWYIVDYNNIHGGYIDFNRTVQEYNELYSKRYKTEKVVYNGLVKYDYEEGKFHRLDWTELK